MSKMNIYNDPPTNNNSSTSTLSNNTLSNNTFNNNTPRKDGIEKIDISNLRSYLLRHNISNNYLIKIQPFELNIRENFSITLTELLRIVPGRRLVFNGVYKDKHAKIVPIVFKLFIDPKKYLSDYNTVSNGNGLLLNNNFKPIDQDAPNTMLLSPAIIAAFSDSRHKISYFLFEYVKEDIFESFTERHKLIISAILALHNDAIAQQDLHLDNFVVKRQGVYCLDTQTLTRMPKLKQRLANFSLFLAQLPAEYYKNWEQYTDLYLVRTLDAPKAKRYILSQAKVNLNKRLTYFNKKSLRNSTNFVQIFDRSNKIFGMAKRAEYVNNADFFKEFQDDPSATINKYVVKMLKDGNTTKVYLISKNNKEYVIKHYLSGSFLSKVLRTIQNYFKCSRARNSWLNSNLLEHLGIGTAASIAYMTRKNFMINDSYFIMEHVKDFERCHELFSTNDVGSYIAKIRELLHILKFLKISHKDFKSVNVGFKNNEVVVLDLDAMRRYRSTYTFKKYQMRDQNRFAKCWEHDSKISELLTAE